MIILLTGPTGVGKTDTSWAILQQMTGVVFLDCDWFASRVPFAWDNESDVGSVFELLSLMIDYYVHGGTLHFVITLTVQMAQFYNKHKNYFNKWQLPIYAFRLYCTNQSLEKRIGDRDRMDCQKQEELKKHNCCATNI